MTSCCCGDQEKCLKIKNLLLQCLQLLWIVFFVPFILDYVTRPCKGLLLFQCVPITRSTSQKTDNIHPRLRDESDAPNSSPAESNKHPTRSPDRLGGGRVWKQQADCLFSDELMDISAAVVEDSVFV